MSISNKDPFISIGKATEKIENQTGAKRLNTRIHGGPGSGTDIRMYLDKASIEALLKAANYSPQRKAQLNHVGLEIDTWVRGDGTSFEVWKLFSAPPTAVL